MKRKFECWTIAYRKRNGVGTILDDLSSPFTCIPNTWRYWCADPHIVEENGNTYIFAELFDKILRHGVIGYCILTESGTTPWKVALKMPFHLSYPHILKRNDDFYMIPESYVANEISVYHAVSFPDSWEKVRVLKADICSVDTTLFTDREETYLFTYQLTHDTEQLVLYSVHDDEFLRNGVCLSKGDLQMRPAGGILCVDNAVYRPAQDCSESYGCALNFYQIESMSPYSEKLLTKITPAMLNTDLGCIADGLHTYNVSDHLEVIDLKQYETDLWFYIMRPIWFIWRCVLKFFRK